MRLPSRTILLALASTLLLACTYSSAKQQQADQRNRPPEEACGEVKALIDSQADGFKNIRTTRRDTSWMEVWNTNFQLVGKGCQVWGWGEGGYSYVCSRTEPNKELAKEDYSKAVKFTRQCLGKQWQEQFLERDKGTAYKTEFSLPGKPVVVAVHGVKARGLFQDEWTVYYFVGDPNDPF